MKLSHKICAGFNIAICAIALVGFLFAAMFALEALSYAGVENPDTNASLSVGFGVAFFYIFGCCNADCKST